MSTQDTMKQKLLALMKKRDVELPPAKQKAQEEIEKLRQFYADIEKEESEVREEIFGLLEQISLTGVTQSNKSILDLPHVAWRSIRRYMEGREYCLLNACLSSPSLEQIFTDGSPNKKLHLLGEKVFSLLILRYYVNRKDLQNCLNTACQDLQYFTGSSWWCFKTSLRSSGMGSVLWKSANFRNRNEIEEFSRKAEQKTNKWDFFKELTIEFAYDYPTGTRSDYDKFFEAAISFQKIFGKYITYVSWYDSFPGIQQLHDICPGLQSILPRLKQVYWSINTNSTYSYPNSLISSQLTGRTVEPIFSLSGKFCFPNLISFNTSKGNIHECYIKSSILKHPVQLVASNQLSIYMPWSDNVVENYDDVLDADTSKFSAVRSLRVDGLSHHLRSIVMLEKFPNVTNVVLIEDQRANLPFVPPGPGFVFPRVKNLTLGFRVNLNLLPRLDILPMHFPLLRHITIKDCAMSCFKDSMTKWQSEGHFNEGVIDVYRLISENRSLKVSNIWSAMPHLITLCVEAGEIFGHSEHLLGEDEERKVYTDRQEIYRRIDGGRILLDVALK